MKTRSHIKFCSLPPRPRQGLTILEMLVSTAMLAMIVLGLTVVFVQTQRAFKTGIKETTITDSARTIVDMITADLGLMSDGQNTNVFNFYWTNNLSSMMVNYSYVNGVPTPIRTNQLERLYILQRTNTAWVGVGYAVSNLLSPSGAPLGVGTLYRFETNWNCPYPALPNLFAPYVFEPFYTAFYQTSQSNVPNLYFTSNYWHPVADGVIDLKIRAFDQNGNDADSYFFLANNNNYFFYPSYIYTNDNNFLEYPIAPLGIPAGALPKALPNSVELEFAILEPEALAQARSLAVNPAALQNYLGSNAATRMEVFRQRVTIAAATR